MRWTTPLIFISAVWLLPMAVFASSPVLPYSAETKPVTFDVKPGEIKQITLQFKNVGTQTWVSGKKTTALYLYGDSSVFRHSSWLANDLPGVLAQKTVKPGATGSATITIKAPKNPGAYRETFLLSVEPGKWVKGSSKQVLFRVGNTVAEAQAGNGAKLIENGESTNVGNTADTDASISSSTTKPLPGKMMIMSERTITTPPGRVITFSIGIKNTGKEKWPSMIMRSGGLTPLLEAKWGSLRQTSWISDTEVAMNALTTKPGEIGFVTGEFRAPRKAGSYIVSLNMVVNGRTIDGGTIELPVIVSSDGIPDADLGITSGLNGMLMLNKFSALPAEPILRVGLYSSPDHRMVVRSNSGQMILSEGASTTCTFEQGKPVTITIDTDREMTKASGSGCTAQTANIFQLQNVDGISPLEITDITRSVSWLPSANDNKFRGKLELRYAPSSGKVWVINEVPMEWYLKGLAETSDPSPMEYQKALLTAARTYAMYHVYQGTKHADETYTVDAKYDQVYRGYGAEIRDPHVVLAVNQTRGQVVAYKGDLAITPYYSRSDGRTRTWTEVWGGSAKPWLVSVKVPWDAGKKLYGHGVGMSATGSIGMANDGKMYSEILKYFYTGTELRLAYE